VIVRARELLVLAAAAALVCSACADKLGEDAAAGTPAELRTPVSIESDSGPIVFSAELAATPAERARGLMFRKSMGDGEGMLFLFSRADQQTFWMHNTLIPLDMVFIKSDRTILGVVENAEPMTDTGRAVPGPSQFVLEINGGLARKRGVHAGQRVAFSATIPER
jgi:uncharacterized membrane protein (UPF0127 family)